MCITGFTTSFPATQEAQVLGQQAQVDRGAPQEEGGPQEVALQAAARTTQKEKVQAVRGHVVV